MEIKRRRRSKHSSLVCILAAGTLSNVLNESIRYFYNFFWWLGSYFSDSHRRYFRELPALSSGGPG
jgi:hypothetical protein